MKDNTLLYIRLLMLLISFGLIISSLSNDNIIIGILMLLLLAFNIQIRNIIQNEGLRVLSLIFDIVFILLINNKFEVLVYFPIFITLIDSIMYMSKYAYAMIMISVISLGYMVKMDANEAAAITSVFIFLLVTIFTYSHKAKLTKIKEIEYLYDDVRKYSYELENAKKQIEGYSQQVESLTMLKERQRISEEIHDTIGHRLAALLMQLEAGTRLLKEDNQNGRALLDLSVENLRETIDVLRQTVRSIRPKVYRNLLFSIEELLRKFKKETGVNIDFLVKGIAFKLYPGVEMVLYKNVQEALTNSVRHGKAKNIVIVLQYEHNNITLTVSNDGIACKKLRKGMGITSMEERLKFVGGSLSINQENGFSIQSSISVKGVD